MLRRSPLRAQSPRTLEQRAIRESVTAAVLRRDGYRCQGARFGLTEHGGRLDPHHIGPTSRYPELRYTLDNLVVLCRLCHRWSHNNPAEARVAGLLK